MLRDVRAIIQNNDIERLVTLAETEGRNLQNGGLTTSQIRLAFGKVRQIEAMWSIEGQREQAERQLMLLKPRIAYQAARDGKEGSNLLRNILAEGIDAVFENTAPGSVERTDRFRRFTELFEAVLAYHKVAGSR
jgi:CRISPR-associated protein Csm2